MKFKITKPTVDNEYGDIIELTEQELNDYPFNASLELFDGEYESVKIIEKTKTISFTEDVRKELKKLKMQELRKVGDSYSVKDTSKKELIEEIIQEKINRGEL